MIGLSLGSFYEKNGRYGRILCFVVDENFRGQGIGKKLFSVAQERLKDQQAQAMIVHSGQHRKETHIFYEKIGFENTGYRFVKKIL